MGLFSGLFGGNSEQLTEKLNQGATIIDVRTAAEFNGGHIKGSINIPVGQMEYNMKKINKMKQPLVLCCASGARSAAATNMLKSNNIGDVYNGGSWSKVNRLLNN